MLLIVGHFPGCIYISWWLGKILGFHSQDEIQLKIYKVSKIGHISKFPLNQAHDSIHFVNSINYMLIKL